MGDVVIRVLGCANTDPHLQAQFLPWKEYLEQNGEAYPPEAQIHEIAAKLGCILESGES